MYGGSSYGGSSYGGTPAFGPSSPPPPPAPTADFSGTPLAGDFPLNVAFTDLSTDTPTSWSWDFGDGDTSTVQNPSHTYTSAGSYTVELEATNASGSDTETKVAYVVVSSPPPPPPPPASQLIQGVDYVVSMSAEAMLGSDLTGVNEDEDNGNPWLDDPSTANGPRRPRTPAGMVRRIRPGGSGAPYSRRRPIPVFRLEITADDDTKPSGTRYTWDGDEFTAEGLQ